MTRKGFCFLILCLIHSLCSAQELHEVELILTNKTSKTGLFYAKGKRLVSQSESIKLDSIKEIHQDLKNSRNHIFVIKTKNFLSDRKHKNAFAYLLYSNNDVQLFHANFSNRLTNKPIDTSYSPNREVFIKWKKDYFSYNIGFIDGQGWKKTEKRIKQFFKKCPKIVQGLQNKTLDSKRIIDIIEFYNKQCLK